MVHSFEIHIKQCKELWEKREALKQPSERKALPRDPVEMFQTGRGGGGEERERGSNINNDDAPPLTLDEINKMATTAFNTESLSTCAFCGRTFLPEKLIIHNRSCTADHPARRVGCVPASGVNRKDDGVSIPRSSSSTPQPHNVQRKERTERPMRPSSASNNASTISSNNSRSPSRERVEGGGGGGGGGGGEPSYPSPVTVGHLGGTSGRSIRNGSSLKSVPFSPSVPGNNSVLFAVSQQLDHLEQIALQLVNSIVELKHVVDIELSRRPIDALATGEGEE